MTPLLLYGANGYTGKLIAHEAVRQGLKPVLAGRNRAALDALAQELGLTRRVFGLERADEIARNRAREFGLALRLHRHRIAALVVDFGLHAKALGLRRNNGADARFQQVTHTAIERPHAQL